MANTLLYKLIPVITAVALLFGGCASKSSGPPPVPPVGAATLPDVTAYLVQQRCSDGQLAVVETGCASAPQRASDPMLSRRHDWPGPTGYQISDSFVSDDGSYFVTTWSYPPFGPFSQPTGDGGEVYVTNGSTVRIASTQDGGTPAIQGFYGAGCGGTGWLIFRNDAPTGSWASVTAYLSDSPIPSACTASVPAYTQYRLENVTIPFLINNVEVDKVIPTVISEHYNNVSIDKSNALERSFFSQGLGRTIWEAWTKTPSTSNTVGRCPLTAWSTPPAAGWYFNDCRYSTNVQPADGTLSGDTFAWPPATATIP